MLLSLQCGRFAIKIKNGFSMRDRRWFLFFLLGCMGTLVFQPVRRLLYIIKQNALIALAKVDQHFKDKIIQRGSTSQVFYAKNGTPQQNVQKIIEMTGGIENTIGENDIVIIKPNAQWWNQGRTNLAAIKGFIDLVLDIDGFSGEVIIAENVHFMDEKLLDSEKDNVRGWVRFSEINGDIDGINHNLNTLIESYHVRGFENVTKIHWRDGGDKLDNWGNGKKGGVVQNTAKDDGYVWDDEDYEFVGFFGLKVWKVKMSYPVFTSNYSGITVDFKNGAFRREDNGSINYLANRPVKFINFAVLNSHGKDTGITSSIKNYMGITDLSCGYWGINPKGYANVHHCGQKYYPYAKAGPIGHFMKTIRKADLNIVTAEWVGWGSRTEVDLAAQEKMILASTDPIALDYIGAKYVIYPHSKKAELHDPDNPRSSIRKFLELALIASGEGTLDESFIQLKSFDYDVV